MMPLREFERGDLEQQVLAITLLSRGGLQPPRDALITAPIPPASAIAPSPSASRRGAVIPNVRIVADRDR
jgi:hypothetical protein